METNRKTPKWGNFGGCVNIYKDLDIADIPRLAGESGVHSVQFSTFENPSENTWHVLNSFFEKYPSIRLSILWGNQTKWDFLRYLPAVKNLGLCSYLTKDFSSIAQYVDLKVLSIGETKTIAVDVSFIKEFQKLEILSIDGMKKGLNAIDQLDNLWSLNLRRVKLKSLDFLSGLNRLRLLKLMFGSYHDLAAIGKLCKLEYLGISRTRRIPNYDFLQGMKSLQFLQFEGLGHLEILPDLSGQIKLEKIQIENLSKLRDIRSMSNLVNLKEFLLYFPEKYNASQREIILEQAFKIAKKLVRLKMTNFSLWDNGYRITELEKRGVKSWDHKLSKWNQDRMGGWTL